MSDSTNTKTKDPNEKYDKFLNGLVDFFINAPAEVFKGFERGILPVTTLTFIGICLWCVFRLRIDLLFLKNVPLTKTYVYGYWRNFISAILLIAPYFLWGVLRLNEKRKLLKTLQNKFEIMGLKNRLNEYPGLVFDEAIDSSSRRMRLSNAGFETSYFEGLSNKIEANLGVYVDKIKEPEDEKGFIDIIYSTKPMPAFYKIRNLEMYKDFSFPIGISRSTEIIASLKQLPHFLVAGITGGGKSAFIRMAVTVLGLNNKDLDILVVDLKKGVDGNVFEGIQGIKVKVGLTESVDVLKNAEKDMDRKFELISALGVSNIDEYNDKVLKDNLQKPVSEKITIMKRQLVVVDEVSELSSKLSSDESEDLNKASQTIDRIARLGRAAGVHLLLGTQKPDSKNLAQNIKSNIPAVVCFQVSNLAQSTVILGNSRACDLPSTIKGRAIYKVGPEMIEVQAPYLTKEKVKEVFHERTKQVPVKGPDQSPDQSQKETKEEDAGSPSELHL